MTWDPARYLRFGDLRTRPAAELLARVPIVTASTVVDLGCGPGNSTQLLAARWPGAHVVGIDSSEPMLLRAKADHPQLEFELGDIEHWAPEESVDVVFANAVLQWLPDHIALLPGLMAKVSGGGSLAIQIPNNYDRPAHVIAHRIVRDTFPEYDGLLADRETFDPIGYYDALALSGVAVDVWETTYLQPLRGASPVVDWTSGTFLRPLLDALAAEPDRLTAFLELYGEAMRDSYPTRGDGVTLMPFPRLFAVATRLP